MKSRLSSRKNLTAWLLILTLAAATPAGALAKVYRANGHDGAEGDPGDGLDYIGGGRGGSSGDETLFHNLQNDFVIIPVSSAVFVTTTWITPDSTYRLHHELRHLREIEIISSGVKK